MSNSLIFLVILVVVFYLLLILPQRRQQKKKAEMMKSLAPGAKIMTASGIYAEIAAIHDDIIVARVAPDVEIEMDSRAVVRVVSEGNGFQADESAHALGAPEHPEEVEDHVDTDEPVDHDAETTKEKNHD